MFTLTNTFKSKRKSTNVKKRIWELDFLRGVALVLMIYFHLIFDMKEFFNYPVNYESGFNYYAGRAAFILFALLSGISCSLSRSNIKRGVRILTLGLLITLSTYLYNPAFTIKFGVLHFIGTSILIYSFLPPLNNYILALAGTIILISGPLISKINVAHNYFFIIGITANGFSSSDYYPLIPYFSLFLYGIVAGKILYAKKTSLINRGLKNNPINSMGRHTLPIYLLHQPIIIVILKLTDTIFSGK